jgi:hypothetical protein
VHEALSWADVRTVPAAPSKAAVRSAVSPAVRGLVVAAGLVAFVALLFVTFVPVGFSPTDEGLVTAQSYQIIHGKVPHRDIVSPRPLGSAIVHTVDFAIPLPRVEAWRLLAIIETTAYTALFAMLVFGNGPTRWGLLRVCGVLLATLLNLNTFPLASWHTTDGLLLVAAGYVLTTRGTSQDRPGLWRTGMLLLGCAVLTKQSFAAGALVGLIVVAVRCHRRGRWRALEVLLSGSLAALPVVFYVGAIAALGGLHDMLLQLGGAQQVPVGAELVQALDPSKQHGLEALAIVILGVAAVAVLWWHAQRRGFRARVEPYLRLAVGAVVAYLVGWAMLGNIGKDELGRRLYLSVGAGNWSIVLFWLAAAVVVARLAVRGSLDIAGVLLLTAGWMASLSWGIANPNFVAGSLALYVACRVWRRTVGVRDVQRDTRLAISAVASALVVVLAAFAWTQRLELVNRDQPFSHETFALSQVDPNFGRVKTNPVTGQYLLDAANCIHSHPAASVAVLPDNAALYPVMGLENPLPADWLFPPEYQGAEAQIRAAVGRMMRRGNYLVLFERVPAQILGDLPAYPKPAPGALPWVYPGGDLLMDIWKNLPGTRLTCGAFGVIYQPGAANT